MHQPVIFYLLLFDVVVQIITTLLHACHTPARAKAYQLVLDDKAMADQVRPRWTRSRPGSATVCTR